MVPISAQSVKKLTLKNGLTVLYEFNPSAPVVSLNMAVKIGSVWESETEAGLSHVLEHMVFKGTKSYKPGDIASQVEALGGELNAYTSFDRTVYYINLPSQYWLKALPFLKEMVFDATIDPIELDREREVVIEELRRGKDNPDSVLGEMLFEQAYPDHPYGRPIIGYEKTLHTFTSEIVLDFYHRWYVPGNMIFAICGDINEKDLQVALDLLESMPEKAFHRPEIAAVSLRHQPKFIKKESNVFANYLCIGFPATPFQHPDTAKLDLLAHLLGGGETSLLEQELKEKKGMVNGIHSYAYTPLFNGLFVIDVIVPNSHLAQIVPEIQKQVEHCKKYLFSSQSLERAKLGMKSSLFYEKQTCEGTARKWMVYETTTGDFRYEEEYLKMIDATTEADVREMAQKYLRWDQSTIATLYPQKTKASQLPKPVKIVPTIKKEKRFELIEEYEDIQKWKHKTGLTVITKENHRLPILSLKMIAPGGVRFENKNNNGITSLMVRLLEKGTLTRSALEIAEICEDIAGHVSGASGRNSWGMSASMLAGRMEKGVEMFLDMLLNPLFDKNEFAKEKRILLDAIRQEEDSLSHLAFREFQKILFKTHPYGMPMSGNLQSIAKLTPKLLKTYHAKLLNPKVTTFSCVGDFLTTDLLNLIDQRISKHKYANHIFKKPNPQKSPGKILEHSLFKDKMQAHVVVGFLGTTITNPDRYALEIINNVLSGQGGRLFLDLRDTQSLAYTVTSTMTEGLEPGYFAAYIGTEPKKLAQATEGLIYHLKKLTQEEMTQGELERAQNYIMGSHELDLQRLSAYASTLATNHLFGFPLTEIENYRRKILSVNTLDCLKVAKKYFKFDEYVLMQIKPKN